MIFFEQTKEEQENIDINLFSKYFSYKTPDKMAQILYYSKSKADKMLEQSKSKYWALLTRFLILMNKINKDKV